MYTHVKLLILLSPDQGWPFSSMKHSMCTLHKLLVFLVKHLVQTNIQYTHMYVIMLPWSHHVHIIAQDFLEIYAI